MPFPYISQPLRTFPETHGIVGYLSATNRLVVEAWISDGDASRREYNERFGDLFATGLRAPRVKPVATLMVLLRHDVKMPRVPDDWHPGGVGRTLTFELHGDPDLLPDLDLPTTLDHYHWSGEHGVASDSPEAREVSARLTGQLRDFIRRQQLTGWGQFEQSGPHWGNVGYLTYLIRAARLGVAAASERMGVPEPVLRGWLSPHAAEEPTQEALEALTSAAKAALAEHGSFYY